MSESLDKALERAAVALEELAKCMKAYESNRRKKKK